MKSKHMVEPDDEEHALEMDAAMSSVRCCPEDPSGMPALLSRRGTENVMHKYAILILRL